MEDGDPREQAVWHGADTAILFAVRPGDWLRAAAMRRSESGCARIDGEVHRGQEWIRCCSHLQATAAGDAPAHPSPRIDGFWRYCTSPKHTTPKDGPDVVVVRYPWHPLAGKALTLLKKGVRGQRAFFRCAVREEKGERRFELPAWGETVDATRIYRLGCPRKSGKRKT